MGIWKPRSPARTASIHRSVVPSSGEDLGKDASGVLSAFYSIERQAGMSIQASLYALWMASATYLGAAVGVAVLLQGELNGGASRPESWVTLLVAVLPLPACAIACYHSFTFSISLVRSRSIESLERALAAVSPADIQEAYEQGVLGSRAETSVTDFKNASVLTKVTSAGAFVLPIASGLALSSASIGLIAGVGLTWWLLAPISCLALVVLAAVQALRSLR